MSELKDLIRLDGPSSLGFYEGSVGTSKAKRELYLTRISPTKYDSPKLSFSLKCFLNKTFYENYQVFTDQPIYKDMSSAAQRELKGVISFVTGAYQQPTDVSIPGMFNWLFSATDNAAGYLFNQNLTISEVSVLLAQGTNQTNKDKYQAHTDLQTLIANIRFANLCFMTGLYEAFQKDKSLNGLILLGLVYSMLSKFAMLAKGPMGYMPLKGLGIHDVDILREKGQESELVQALDNYKNDLSFINAVFSDLLISQDVENSQNVTLKNNFENLSIEDGLAYLQGTGKNTQDNQLEILFKILMQGALSKSMTKQSKAEEISMLPIISALRADLKIDSLKLAGTCLFADPQYEQSTNTFLAKWGKYFINASDVPKYDPKKASWDGVPVNSNLQNFLSLMFDPKNSKLRKDFRTALLENLQATIQSMYDFQVYDLSTFTDAEKQNQETLANKIFSFGVGLVAFGDTPTQMLGENADKKKREEGYMPLLAKQHILYAYKPAYSRLESNISENIFDKGMFRVAELQEDQIKGNKALTDPQRQKLLSESKKQFGRFSRPGASDEASLYNWFGKLPINIRNLFNDDPYVLVGSILDKTDAAGKAILDPFFKDYISGKEKLLKTFNKGVEAYNETLQKYDDVLKTREEYLKQFKGNSKKDEKAYQVALTERIEAYRALNEQYVALSKTERILKTGIKLNPTDDKEMLMYSSLGTEPATTVAISSAVILKWVFVISVIIAIVIGLAALYNMLLVTKLDEAKRITDEASARMKADCLEAAEILKNIPNGPIAEQFLAKCQASTENYKESLKMARKAQDEVLAVDDAKTTGLKTLSRLGLVVVAGASIWGLIKLSEAKAKASLNLAHEKRKQELELKALTQSEKEGT